MVPKEKDENNEDGDNLLNDLGSNGGAEGNAKNGLGSPTSPSNISLNQ